MSRILSLIIKELLAVWQDKRSRIILIMPPLIQFCIFTFAATLDVRNVSLGILNHDLGRDSIDLIAHFNDSNLFTPIYTFDRESDIREALDTQKVMVALTFDEKFSRSLASKKAAAIQLLTDGRRSNSAQIAVGYALEIISDYGRTFDKPSERSKTIDIRTRHLFNPNLYYPWFNVAGLIGILSMLTSFSVSALSIVREREMGTLDQLLVTPIGPGEILIGKALPAVLIGLFEGILMLTLGITFLGLVVQGSLPLLILSLLAFITAIVGIGLFVSAIVETQQQATLGLFLLMLPTVTLSGFATPVENMPEWMQWLAMGNPLKYFLIISRGICIKGIDAVTVIQNIWPMVCIASATLSLAIWTFRKRCV